MKPFDTISQSSSYSLYIWQQLALFPKEMGTNYWFQRFPQNVAFVFLFASISYYAVELPFLALKGHFTRLRPARKQAIQLRTEEKV